MKLSLLPFLFLCGCTVIHTQHGADQFWGDYEALALKDGAVTFTATKMTHSGVVKAHWHGVIGLGGEALGAYTAGIGAPVVGSLVTGTSAIVNRPTSRATPIPKP